MRPSKTPIPEQTASAGASPAPEWARVAAESADLKQLLAAPALRRFATPGAVRFALDIGAPVSRIKATPLGGLLLSAKDRVYNVTSRGQQRWQIVAGVGHRLYSLGESEVVWSPAFARITRLLGRGQTGWFREVRGRVGSDGADGLYVLDGSTAAAIGGDGADKWRASLEGVRELEGPFPCANGVLFHGVSGQVRAAVQLTIRGAVVHTIPLERGALLMGAGPRCEPLVYDGEAVDLLDARGRALWRRPTGSSPFVERLDGGFAVMSSAADKALHLDVIADDGRVVRIEDAPLFGRPTAMEVLSGTGLDVAALGVCLDVTSPCSRPDGLRGPFNALATADRASKLRLLVRHIQGHLGFAPYPGAFLVLASSATESATEVTLLDAAQAVVWRVALPGRLSAGPYVGVSGEVYVATCRGWGCGPPYLLFSVTGKERADEEPAREERR